MGARSSGCGRVLRLGIDGMPCSCLGIGRGCCSLVPSAKASGLVRGTAPSGPRLGLPLLNSASVYGIRAQWCSDCSLWGWGGCDHCWVSICSAEVHGACTPAQLCKLANPCTLGPGSVGPSGRMTLDPTPCIILAENKSHFVQRSGC